MYALDLKRSFRKVAPRVPVKHVVYERPVIIDAVGRAKCKERFAKGDKLITAYFEHKLVAYLFAAASDTWVGEIEDCLNVAAGEVYLYDAHTAEDYRGMRIYPSLICEAVSYFSKKGYRSALIFSSEHNVDSIKGIERSGFRRYGRVHFRNYIGLKTWRYKIEERFVNARFSNEN